jgi:hypothetical protein
MSEVDNLLTPAVAALQTRRKLKHKGNKMKKITLPSNCGVLADMIDKALKSGDGFNENALAGLREELEECLEFLNDIPENAVPANIDIVSNFFWSEAAKKEIKALSKQPTSKSKRPAKM